MRALKAQTPKQEKQSKSLIEIAKKALKIESDAVAALIDRIDGNFAAVVHLLNKCKGHVVVIGMGKSGLVGNKIAATFSSIGLPAIFLHAAEAGHGDIGIISREDITLIISNSGETEEIIKLLPILNRFQCTLVAMTGNPDSTLAQRCGYLLNVGVQEEACSKDLVPTASTTATLAMGDALAMAFLDIRGFREEDFAKTHPGGSLGRRLLTTVNDLMRTGDEIPKVAEKANIYDVLREMSGKLLGMTVVVDREDRFQGIITDGDLRRLIEKKKDITEILAQDFMVRNPKTIQRDRMATQAVSLMENHSITSLVVTEDNKKVDGIIHLQDLLKAGIV